MYGLFREQWWKWLMGKMKANSATDSFTFKKNGFSSKSDEATSKHKQPDPIDFLIVTRIPENTYKFKWIVQQFSTLSTNIALNSTSIPDLPTSSYRLKLVKYENGFGLFHVNSKPKAYPNAEKFTRKFEYQVSASDCRGKELMKWSICFSDNSKSGIFKIGEYMEKTLEIFPDDLLILDCNLKVILIPTTEKIQIDSKPSLESTGWKKLTADMKALYQNSLDTDVTLVVGTDKIRAHKLILTARSTVFKKIFYHDVIEAEQNSVAITDVQFSALQRLVEYLYSGNILDDEINDMDLQELYDLYYAADKYEVMDLLEMVGNALLGRIQVDNASKILAWADRHNDKDVKSKIMNFIRLNFETVFNTDTWDSCALHHPRLAAEVVNFCAKKLKTSKN